MNKKLTITAIVSLLIFIVLYGYSFPSLDKNIEITSKQAEEISNDFLRSMGYNPEDYISSTILINDQNTRTFLEDTVGFSQMENLTESKIPTLKWSTVYYKELELEHFIIYLTPEGKVVSYHHFINETSYGESLTQEEALNISKNFLSKHNINIENYSLIDRSTTEKQNRVDHNFEWKQTNFSIPYKSSNATLNVRISVSGDEVNIFSSRYLDIPEEYYHDQAKTESKMIVFGLISGLITIATYIAIIVIFAKRYKQVNKKTALIISTVIGLISIVQAVNSFPLISYSYNLESSLFVYYLTVSIISLIGAVFSFIGIFLVTGAGQVLCKELYPHTVKILDKVKSSDMKKQIVNGYLIGAILLGYLAVFYAIGKLFFDTWTPVQINNLATFSVLLPFLVPITISLVAAITEEFLFRMFAIPFIEKVTKQRWLALLIPAMVWAFAHSSYTVSPFYLRFIELTIAGILFGIFFLRFGILSVVVAHYTINATLISIPFLVNPNPYYIISGVIIIGLALVPIGLTLIGSKRSRVVESF